MNCFSVIFLLLSKDNPWFLKGSWLAHNAQVSSLLFHSLGSRTSYFQLISSLVLLKPWILFKCYFLPYILTNIIFYIFFHYLLTIIKLMSPLRYWWTFHLLLLFLNVLVRWLFTLLLLLLFNGSFLLFIKSKPTKDANHSFKKEVRWRKYFLCNSSEIE